MRSFFDWFKSSPKKSSTNNTGQESNKKKDFPGLILSLMKADTYSGYYPKPKDPSPSKEKDPKPKP